MRIFFVTLLLVTSAIWSVACSSQPAQKTAQENPAASPEGAVTQDNPQDYAGQSQDATGLLAPSDSSQSGELSPQSELPMPGSEDGVDMATLDQSGLAKLPPDQIPSDIFGHYKTWPPQKITDDEAALLKRAVAVLETTKGVIKIRFFVDNAPLHSANFVKLVQEHYYDGLIFHRIIPGFMSQGGDPDGTGAGGPGYTIPAEFGKRHDAGRVAAARTGDDVNPTRASSGSQFYMCHTRERTAGLDGMYTVFGEIVEGQDVNLKLTPTRDEYDSPIPGVVADKIIRAYIEWDPVQ